MTHDPPPSGTLPPLSLDEEFAAMSQALAAQKRLREKRKARIDCLVGLLMVSAYGIVAAYELARKVRNPARVIRWQRIALAWWAVTGVAVPVLTLAYKLHPAVAVVGSALSGLSPLYWGLLRWLLRREEARLHNAKEQP